MRSFLTILLPAAALGLAVAFLGPLVGFQVNRIGVIAGAVAVGLALWIVWHALPAYPVEWPDERVEPQRRNLSEWALESLLTNALRGQERSLRELARQFGELTHGRDDLSPALSSFITTARDGQTPPRIDRRDLHAFLKEISP